MSRILAIILIFCFTNSFCQTRISGRIIGSQNFAKKLFIFKINRIDPHEPVILDTILIENDGSFSYTFRKQSPQDLLYKIFLPPKSGNPFHTYGTVNKNYFYLTTEGSEKITIVAKADSLFYSYKVEQPGVNKELMKFRDLYYPLYELEKTYDDSIKLKPEKEFEYKQRALPMFMGKLDNIRSQLVPMLDTATRPSTILTGVLNLYEANFGKMDTSITYKYIHRIKDDNLLIVRNTYKLGASAKSNRVGMLLPDVTLTDVRGRKHQLKNNGVKFTVIDFWASWCSPCRYSNKNELPKFYNKYKDKVRLIGITIDEDLNKWKTAVEKDNTTWPQFVDKQYALKKLLEVYAIPLYLVLDKDYNIVFESMSVYEVEVFLQTGVK